MGEKQTRRGSPIMNSGVCPFRNNFSLAQIIPSLNGNTFTFVRSDLIISLSKGNDECLLPGAMKNLLDGNKRVERLALEGGDDEADFDRGHRRKQRIESSGFVCPLGYAGVLPIG